MMMNYGNGTTQNLGRVTRGLTVFALGVLLAAGQPKLAHSASQPIETGVARQFVTDLGTQALSLLRDNNLSPGQRNERFAGLMLDHVDFRELGDRVLARSNGRARRTNAANFTGYLRPFSSIR